MPISRLILRDSTHSNLRGAVKMIFPFSCWDSGVLHYNPGDLEMRALAIHTPWCSPTAALGHGFQVNLGT